MDFRLFVFILVLIISFAERFAYDFCSSREQEKEVCGNDLRYIVCSESPMNRNYVATAPMTRYLIRTLLKAVNMVRDQIAGGGFCGFPIAARMRELAWSPELEYIAMHRVQRCSLSEKVCYGSTNFKTISEINSVFGQTTRDIRIQESVKGIFKQIRKQANLILEPYKTVQAYSFEIANVAPEFSTIINDQASKVGCAISYCTNCTDSESSDRRYCVFLTCLFDATNTFGCRVYAASSTMQSGDECYKYRSQRSNVYRNLCVNNARSFARECVSATINPNDLELLLLAKENCYDEPDLHDICSKEIEPKICYQGHERHFLCYSDAITSQGDLMNLFKIRNYERNLIVDYHNKRREEIAAGMLVKSYPKAARMRELRWSKELEYLAEKRVKLCNHDENVCANTRNFRNMGENVQFYNNTKEEYKLQIQKAMEEWYSGKSFIKSPEKRMIRHEQEEAVKENSNHFVQMVVDEAQRIGCSMAMCKNCQHDSGSKKKCYIFICHYDVNVLNEYGVYKVGQPTSLCGEYATGKSGKYKNLCAIGPLIDYTYWTETELNGWKRKLHWPQL